MINKDGKFLVEQSWYDGVRTTTHDTIDDAKETGKIYEHLGFPYDQKLGSSDLHSSCKSCPFNDEKPCIVPEMKDLKGLTMVEDIRG
jgi:hypothetical protein